MPETPHISTPNHMGSHHIGAELRACRESRGESAADIAQALNIQTHYIRAIEDLDSGALPAVGYVLGYVRSYARHVGLDSAAAVARYKTDSAAPDDLGRASSPHFVPTRSVRLPRGMVAALTVLACAGVLAFWYSSAGPAVATPGTLTEMLDKPTSDKAAFAPQALPTDPNILTLKATAPSWVEVRDHTGRIVMSRIMVTGERWSTESGIGQTLSARDGGAIELYAGKDNLGLFGTKGVAFGGKPLDPDSIMVSDELVLDTPETE